jgi:phage terminase large subunit-like protein
VRAACKRHLRDLDTGTDRGLRYDEAAARRAIGFFADVLRLNGGEFEGLPYELLPWQCFIVGSLFGWKAADGTRRFRMAYVETGKGSGKSPLAAGIGMYGLVADGEVRAEIYAAATKKDQAMVLFRDAVAMYEQSPALRARLVPSGSFGNIWNLAYHATGSFFRPISADDGQSGPRPHVFLIDEVHEHRSATVVEMLRAGTKSRRQALGFAITNSGSDKQSVCWHYHEYGAKVAAGQLEDDAFFAFICGLDKGDDPFADEACWPKANPSLAHGLPGLKYIREQVTQARGMPSKEAIVRRLNFCQWTDAHAPWLSADVWMGNRAEFGEADLLGRRCFAGLDLSSTQDLTALVLAFEPRSEGEPWRVLPYFWLPGDGLARKADADRVPYLAWRDAGHLRALPGKAIDKLAVLHQVIAICERFTVLRIAYDRWRIEDLLMLARNEGAEGLPFVPFGQGFKDMAPAIDEIERLLLANRLQHNGNPVLTWCAANATLTKDPAGNRKMTKEKSYGRIDGMVALAMAIGCVPGRVEVKAPVLAFG